MELRIDKLKAGYGEKNVVDEITFTVCSGRVTGIAGPNGVGKSTLLKCVAGLMRPAGGCISLDGSDMGKMNSRERARVLAYVPQKPALTFPMQAEDFIMLGRRPYVEWSLREKDYAVAEEVIRYLDIAHLREKYVDEISGGEYQKVMLARALVQEPKVLLLDEPTSALDIRHQMEVMQILRRVSREKKLYCASGDARPVPDFALYGSDSIPVRRTFGGFRRYRRDHDRETDRKSIRDPGEDTEHTVWSSNDPAGGTDMHYGVIMDDWGEHWRRAMEEWSGGYSVLEIGPGWQFFLRSYLLQRNPVLGTQKIDKILTIKYRCDTLSRYKFHISISSVPTASDRILPVNDPGGAGEEGIR